MPESVDMTEDGKWLRLTCGKDRLSGENRADSSDVQRWLDSCGQPLLNQRYCRFEIGTVKNLVSKLAQLAVLNIVAGNFLIIKSRLRSVDEQSYGVRIKYSDDHFSVAFRGYMSREVDLTTDGELVLPGG